MLGRAEDLGAEEDGDMEEYEVEGSGAETAVEAKNGQTGSDEDAR